eukprot:gene7756-12226_t
MGNKESNFGLSGSIMESTDDLPNLKFGNNTIQCNNPDVLSNVMDIDVLFCPLSSFFENELSLNELFVGSYIFDSKDFDSQFISEMFKEILLKGIAISTHAEIIVEENIIIGDKKQGCLLLWASKKFKKNITKMRDEFEIINYINEPKDRKRASVIIKNEKTGDYEMYTRGSFNLNLFSKYFNLEGKEIKLSEELKKKLKKYENDKKEEFKNDETNDIELMFLGYKNLGKEKKNWNFKDEFNFTLISLFLLNFNTILNLKEKIVSFKHKIILYSKKDEEELLKFGQRIGLISDISSSILTNKSSSSPIMNQSTLQNIEIDLLRNEFKNYKIFSQVESNDLLLLIEIAQSLNLLVGYISSGNPNDSICLKDSNIGFSFLKSSELEIDSSDILILNNSIETLFSYLRL